MGGGEPIWESCPFCGKEVTILWDEKDVEADSLIHTLMYYSIEPCKCGAKFYMEFLKMHPDHDMFEKEFRGGWVQPFEKGIEGRATE